MKSKGFIIFVICIVFISIIPFYLILISLNSDSSSPESYSTIAEFEKITGILVYNFYDLDEFIIYNRKTPLETSPNYPTISLLSNKKEEKNYRIETIKKGHNSFYSYQVYSTPFIEITKDMKKDVMDTGVLYQHNGYDEAFEEKYFAGIFVKESLYYQINFLSNELSVSDAEQKMIDYIKLVENIN